MHVLCPFCLSLSSHCLEFGEKEECLFLECASLSHAWHQNIFVKPWEEGLGGLGGLSSSVSFFQMGSGVKPQRSSFTRSFIETLVIGPPLSFIFSQIHQAWQAGNSSRRGALLQNPPLDFLSLSPHGKNWGRIQTARDVESCESMFTETPLLALIEREWEVVRSPLILL